MPRWRQFARSILRRIFFRGIGIFGRQTRIKNTPELDVAGIAARRDDKRFLSVNDDSFRGFRNIPFTLKARERLSGFRIDFR